MNRIKSEENRHSTIRNQMKEDWFLLDPAIRERFERDPHEGEEIAYEGVMHTIRRSKMGWLFANLTRAIGNPLTPYQGADIPMDVILHKKSGHSGVYWKRIYRFPDKKPYVVSSVKKEGRNGEMMECVGGGFGMLLDIHGAGKALHFESTRYFWQIGRMRIPLPHWLSPGQTHVIHTDLGNGDFMFTLSMTHLMLGETFFQEGTFRRKAV